MPNTEYREAYQGIEKLIKEYKESNPEGSEIILTIPSHGQLTLEKVSFLAPNMLRIDGTLNNNETTILQHLSLVDFTITSKVPRDSFTIL